MHKAHSLTIFAAVAIMAIAVCAGLESQASGAIRATAKAGVAPPTVPKLTPDYAQALGVVGAAETGFLAEHSSCARFKSHKADRGSPGEAMLSTFGVLRLAARAPQLPSPIILNFQVFINYVRTAQRRFGTTVEVFPAASGSDLLLLTRSCAALEDRALNARAATSPKNIRSLVRQQIRIVEYDHEHPEGVCAELSPAVDAVCAPLLLAKSQGALVTSKYGSDGAIFSELVPDGVAKITARFPATTGKSATVVVPVTHNVALWKMANEPETASPEIVWRARSGQVIQTIPAGFTPA